ncbi:MAG: site-specific DNA-methyltransferase [Paraprevotella sp.]|nr:site-specific DNA-methyltransferase [Paraprevotella sp.]
MAQNKINKLELTWIGKDEEPLAVEPRLLIETPKHSFGEVETGTLPNGKPWKGNMLIHGDNLLALKALEQDFAGQIKCIYIDPPYNTGSAFEHYDDNLEHSQWLNLMRPRLQIFYNLLSTNGSLWISIDDDERDYLKVMCDEIFGRENFVSSIVWQKKFSSQANSEWLSDSHDYILIYAKRKLNWHPNLLPRTDIINSRYKNPDNDLRGPWTSGDCSVSLMSGQRGAQYAKTGYSPNLYEIKTPSGRIVNPPTGNCWRFSKERFAELVSDNRIWFGVDGNNVPRYKRFLSEVQSGIVAQTWWQRDDVGDNQEAKREVKVFNDISIFATPKPERLIERVLTLGSNPGDLVLDSFLGSGTTAAVAHKMGRRWIGVELGDHAYTHCAVRMRKVIEGEQGGISKSQNWKGGGGFKFYELAPSLLNHDKYGNLVINKEYNADMLAAAMAKHQGFTYSPDAELYWKQGHSSEHDFIFTTTQLLTVEMLESIHEQLDENESLLICCSKFQPGCRDKYANITIKKIPKVLLDTCEFDRDDYSLNIVSMPDGIEDEEWEDWDDSQDSSETEISPINPKEKTLFD